MASGSTSEHTDAFSRPVLPKFKQPEDFKRYSTHHWTCKVCVRESLQHLYLMTPPMAEAHERNAYHRYTTSRPLYQLKQFSPEANTAWDGPSPDTDTFAWLREKEFREYNESKAQEWAKENPDWNAYDPEKDEFLHPHLDSGWRNKKSKGKAAKNAATKFTPRRQQQQRQQEQQKQKKENVEDDADTVRVIRKGMSLGYYTYDPLPKPAKDIDKWVEGLKNASRKRNDLAPAVDWNTPFATEHVRLEEIPLTSQVTKALLEFGIDRSRKVKMDEKKKEEMYLFLELPTAEKVRRIEALAMRLCNPSLRNKVIDETQYWN